MDERDEEIMAAVKAEGGIAAMKVIVQRSNRGRNAIEWRVKRLVGRGCLIRIGYNGTTKYVLPNLIESGAIQATVTGFLTPTQAILSALMIVAELGGGVAGPHEFARAAGVSVDRARATLQDMVSCGGLKRVPDTEAYELTRRARGFVSEEA